MPLLWHANAKIEYKIYWCGCTFSPTHPVSKNENVKTVFVVPQNIFSCKNGSYFVMSSIPARYNLSYKINYAKYVQPQLFFFSYLIFDDDHTAWLIVYAKLEEVKNKLLFCILLRVKNETVIICIVSMWMGKMAWKRIASKYRRQGIWN